MAECKTVKCKTESVRVKDCVRLDGEDWPAWLRLSKEAGICIQGMYVVKCMTHCSNARKLFIHPALNNEP